jgi:glycerol-3-phosphate dehydrogenase
VEHLAMSSGSVINLDVVVFGGGAAGLWLLDELHRGGFRVLLLESGALGSGQTIASQGIIHGGLKYTLKGMFTGSADAVRQMPDVWRGCLAGDRVPDLSHTRLRAPSLCLWHTQSVSSRVGMFGAKSLLSVKPEPREPGQWPAPLVGCAGRVYRLPEQVIDPASFVNDLAQQHRDRILQIDSNAITFDVTAPGQVDAIHLREPDTDAAVTLKPRWVVLTAGGGSAALRERVGLLGEAMQRRPLHMVMARGRLPLFHGHCVDGNRTRVTVTSDTDSASRTVWQIGGQVAEDGVSMEPPQLASHTKAELLSVMGKVDLEDIEWSTYRVDRAEAATGGGVRPDSTQVIQEGNVVTGWPTKLVLAPALAGAIVGRLGQPGGPAVDLSLVERWPRPPVALLPWEAPSPWFQGV